MCGISGYYAIQTLKRGPHVIERMTQAIAHRGPDDEGLALINPNNGDVRNLLTKDSDPAVKGADMSDSHADFAHQIALGHRRYSIIDLSPNGHQPFWSSDGNICVCFNGEIYNYVEIREELEKCGHKFRTTSDTEVLAEAFLEWGVEAFSRFVGFWALSLYDARKGRLLLARDRMGKASLFVSRLNGSLWWSSEIKGLVAGVGDGVLQVRDQAVADFLIYSFRDVREKTFYENVETFPKASYAWVSDDGSIKPVQYWALPDERLSESEITPNEAGEELRSRIAEALRVRLRADVPVGFELSGGLDSSTLMAIAATNGQSVSAFSIGFPGTEADEQSYAKLVYERYRDRAEFHVVNHVFEDVFDVGDYFFGHMDEPVHSPNVLSIQRIWQEMRHQGFRVTISGNAGDELFAGYPGVYHSIYLWSLLQKGELRKFNRECSLFSENPGSMLSTPYIKRFISTLLAGARIMGGVPRQRMSAKYKMLRASGYGFNGTVEPSMFLQRSISETLKERMGDMQMNYWLRISNISCMAIPIEIRSPLLDHRVVEFAFQLPASYFIRDGWLKWIVRQAMQDHLPDEILWRTRKSGFPFPYREWLKASKDRFFAEVKNDDNPYVDFQKLAANYDQLARNNPLLLWRFISISLWWKKCVLGIPLDNKKGALAKVA